jgi:hypothetical protein
MSKQSSSGKALKVIDEQDRTRRAKHLFLQHIQDIPIIRHAIRKAGVQSHTTYYRWRKSDPEFAKDADEALEMARGNVTDAAWANVLQGVEVGDKTCTFFWLKMHAAINEKAKQHTAQSTEELSDEQKALLNESLLHMNIATPTEHEQ